MTIKALANTSVFKLTSVAQSGPVSAKLSLPVDSGKLLYSRYKHVYGTPSIKSDSGLSLAKLRAIDSLIDRLISIRGRNTYFVNSGVINDEDAAFTIERLQKELNSLVSGSNPPLSAGNEQNDTGFVLNFVA